MYAYCMYGEGEGGEKILIANRNQIVGIVPTYRVKQTQNHKTSDSKLHQEKRQQVTVNRQQTADSGHQNTENRERSLSSVVVHCFCVRQNRVLRVHLRRISTIERIST
jgi:hypothetical protein